VVFVGTVVAVAVATFWPQILHPALYRDDWQFAWDRLAYRHDFFANAFRDALTQNRPIYALVNHLLTAWPGTNARALLLIALLTGAFECLAAFVLLNVLGFGPWTSGLLGALLMVFPLADSTRLAASMATTTLGVTFYLVGATLAVRTLAEPSLPLRRRHAAAIGFYLLSLVTYESAAGLIVLSFLVYRIVAPSRTAIMHWLVDVAVIGILVGAFLIVNRVFGQHVNSAVALSDLPRRIGTFAYESVGALSLSIIPAGPALVTKLVVIERGAALVVVLALLIGGYLWLRGVSEGQSLAAIRGWGWTIMAAAAVLPATYLPYLVASGAYHPLARGEGDRTNQLAAIPLLVIAYGVLVITCRVAVGFWEGWRGRRSWRPTYALIPAVALILASAVTVRADITRWQYTAHHQAEIQGIVKRALARQPRPFAVAVVGPLDLFSPGIPHPADHQVVSLLGTFSVPLGRLMLAEYLVAPGQPFTCGRDTMYPVEDPHDVSLYGQTLLIRSPWRHATFIEDRRACLRAKG
jgi:hypothetical protein